MKWFSSQNRAVLMKGWVRMFCSLSPTADAPKRVWQDSSCSLPLPTRHTHTHTHTHTNTYTHTYSLPFSLFLYPPALSLPPSHLIAFDKCPYWLHIIRCSGGSLRLYYSAHTPHLFSILHGWHTCFCKVRIGPGLCQWNSFMSCRIHWRKGNPGECIGHGFQRHC